MPADMSNPGADPMSAAMSAGCDVTLASTFTIPGRCASCGGPKQMGVTTSKSKGKLGGSTTRTLTIPYCNACAARVFAANRSGRILFGVAMLAALAVPAVGLVLTGVKQGPLVGLSAVFGVVLAIVARQILAPKDVEAPATSPAEAAWIVSFKRYRTVLHCTNGAWGAELARLNNVQPMAKKRSPRFGVWSVIAAAGVAAIAGLMAWEHAHPHFMADNATGSSMVIWVDGAAGPSVAPDGHVDLRLPHGHHKLAHASEGTSPAAAAEVDVRMGHEYLYAPEESACYRLVVSSYGSATIPADMARGPLPRKTVYELDKVDTWFGENPHSVQVGQFECGATRTALQRNPECGGRHFREPPP